MFDVENYPIPIGLLGNASVAVTNIAGDTLYYADHDQVSSSNFQGVLLSGSSATFIENLWVVSASRSTVTVAFTAPSGGPSGGSGGLSSVSDGTHSVSGPTSLVFAGATVADGGGGVADVSVSGGGGASVVWASGLIYVDHYTGSDTTGTGSILQPYQTITAALNSIPANNSATIKVGKGTYVEEIWLGSNGQPVIIEGTAAPNSNTGAGGTTIQAPTDTQNCINVIGVPRCVIRNVSTRSHSINSTGVGLRILAADQTMTENWIHDNQGNGFPTKRAGGIGLAISHSEKCQINNYSPTWCSQGIILGVEADEEHFITGQLAANYQDIYAGPWEGYRSRLASSITNSQTTVPLRTNGSRELQSSGMVFTKDYVATPAQPTGAASGTGSTVTAGTYTFAVAYTDAYGRETLASPTQTQVVASGQNLVINAPAASTGAKSWYAYVSQAGGTTLTRQQALGSPTALGTNLTLTANPTTTGFQPQTGTTAFASEGIAYTGNAADQLTGCTRGIVGSLVSAINAVTTAIALQPLSPGNSGQNGQPNPQMGTVIPASGTVTFIDTGEQVTYTSWNPVGNGQVNLQGVTRGANATTAASHSSNALTQDTSLASAVAHSSAVEVVQSVSGVWGGGCTFDVYKSTNCQSTAAPAGDYTEEWWSGGHTDIDYDSVEIITNLVRFFNTALAGNLHIKRVIAGASTVTDDTTGTKWEMPSGNGSLILSSLSSSCIVNQPTLAALPTDNGKANRIVTGSSPFPSWIDISNPASGTSIPVCAPGADPTASLQAAINYFNTNNLDGTIYWSKPVGTIAGATQSGSGTVGGTGYSYSGQIVFPARAWSQGPITIRIKGLNPIPNFEYGAPLAAGGAELVSNLATSGASVFAAIPGDVQLTVPMSDITVIFEDVIVRTPSNPQCSGIDANYLVGLEFRGDCRVDTTDTVGVTLTGAGFGVRFPPYQNGGLARVAGNLEILGYPTGAVTSEHFTADVLFLEGNSVGWAPGGNGVGHSQRVGRVVLQGNSDGVKPTAGAQIKVDVLDMGDVTTPYSINTVINDPNNNLAGQVQVFPWNRTAPVGFPVIGASKLRIVPMNGPQPYPQDAMTTVGNTGTTNYLGVSDRSHNLWLPFRGAAAASASAGLQTDWVKNGTTLKSVFTNSGNAVLAVMRQYLGRAGASRTWRAIVTTNNGAFNAQIPIGMVVAGANANNYLYVLLYSGTLNGSTNTVSLNRWTTTFTTFAQSAAAAVAANTQYIVDTIISNPPGGPYAITVKVGTTLANLATVLTTIEAGTGTLSAGTYTLSAAEYATLTDTEQFETRDGVGTSNSDTGSAFSFAGAMPS